MEDIAIIGIGNWGRVILKELSGLANFKYFLSTGSSDNLLWVKKNYPTIKSAKHIEQILQDKSIKSVIVATPISTHYDISKKLLLAGKNVFVEKPPATTLEQAKDLLRLAKINNVTIFSDNIFLYSSAFNTLKSLLKNNKVRFFQSVWLKHGSFKESMHWNLAYHDIYLIIAILGNKLKISSSSLQKNALYIELKTENGNNIVIFITREFKGEKTKLIMVSLDDCQIVWNNLDLIMLKNNNISKVVVRERKSALKHAFLEFNKEILSRKIRYANFRVSMESIKILEKIA